MGFPVGLKGRACFAAAVGAERGVGVAGDTRRGGHGAIADDPFDHRVAEHIGRAVGGVVVDLRRFQAVVSPDRREVGGGHQVLQRRCLLARAVLRIDLLPGRRNLRSRRAEGVETADVVAAARGHLVFEGAPHPVGVLAAAHMQPGQGVFDAFGSAGEVELAQVVQVADLRHPFKQRLHRYPSSTS